VAGSLSALLSEESYKTTQKVTRREDYDIVGWGMILLSGASLACGRDRGDVVRELLRNSVLSSAKVPCLRKQTNAIFSEM
jgi:hypothetical protein